jgi:Flp pilus assembly protein TadG
MRDEGGTVIVLVAAMLVVLLGMGALVVDAGVLFESRRNLVTAADSAAMAGATEYAHVILTGGTSSEARVAAEAKARQYAISNGVAAGNIQVSVNEASHKVTVDVGRDNALAFARVLGVHSAVTGAHAAAIAGPVHTVEPSDGRGVLPIYVSPATVSYLNQRLNLREGTPPPRDPGNFTALALGQPGASNYLNNLKYGYPGTISKNDYVDTQTGNITNPTLWGIEYRIDKCDDECPGTCTWDNHSSGCPRVVTLLVCDFQELHGHQSIRVDGFLTFFLESVTRTGGNVTITGYVINDIRDGKVSGSDGSRGSDYGTWAVNLIE